MARSRQERNKIRHRRLRRKLSGTTERPRLCLHKSGKHLYAQLVDDTKGTTLVFLTTNSKANKSESRSFCNQTWAKKVGEAVGRKAVESGVKKVVFDRGGARYHGVVRVFAEAAREAGLDF